MKRFTILLTTLVSLQVFGQKDFKFHPSGLATGMNNFGFEYTRKDMGFETLVGFSGKQVSKEVNGIKRAYEAKRYVLGGRLNFYKKLDKGAIDGKYISLFGNYSTSEIKTLVPEQKRILCAGLAYGKKWLIYNRLGFQADAGLGFNAIDLTKTPNTTIWVETSSGTDNAQIALLDKFSLPVRVSVLLRL